MPFPRYKGYKTCPIDISRDHADSNMGYGLGRAVVEEIEQRIFAFLQLKRQRFFCYINTSGVEYTKKVIHSNWSKDGCAADRNDGNGVKLDKMCVVRFVMLFLGV